MLRTVTHFNMKKADDALSCFSISAVLIFRPRQVYKDLERVIEEFNN